MPDPASREATEGAARLKLTSAGEAFNRDVSWEILAQHINDLIIVTDLNGAIFYASPAVRQMGYEPHELIGLTGADLIHPDELPRFLANRPHVHSGDGAFRQDDREHRFRKRDGSWIWLEGNPSLLYGPDGRPASVLNIFRDVTERRLARDALREQARRAEIAEDVAGVGYWRFDVATNAVTWSRQMFLMYDLPPGHVPSLATAMSMTHPEDHDAALARLDLALATGAGWSDHVTRIERPGGETRYLNGRVVCEKDASGKVVAVFGTLVDVTEQRLARQKIEESERRYR
ncbi:MAG TPA: PAS domain S-box protein, partial [Phenylobacterium sp.]|nr:PAS domain S-box protein [Phenylobacterium sp.]